MNPFETETMADLCLRQGHRQEALAIYQRLIARATDETERARMNGRVAAIQARGAIPKANADVADRESPLPVPGVRARISGDRLTLEWSLPAATRSPTVELLLVKQGPGGVETETRSLAVEGAAGKLVLTVEGLHLARAAAGTRSDGRFVPLTRG